MTRYEGTGDATESRASLLGVVIGGAVSVAALADGGRRAEALVPVGMLLFAWILASASFTFEARKAEHRLRALVRTHA